MPEIPRAKFFKKGDPVYVRAQQIWMILVGTVMIPTRPRDGKVTITYGDLAKKMGMDSRAGHTLSAHLGIIGDYCVENDLPALNIIVVNRFGTPGDGVIGTDEASFQDDLVEVTKQDWHAIRVPSTGALRRTREWQLS